MRPIPRFRRTFLLVCLALVVLVVTGAVLWPTEERSAAASPGITSRHVRIDVLDGPGQQQRVQIDLMLYAPAETPAPVVVLSHGFGDDKSSLAGPARQLATRGFTVLTYSSRGFGRSTGKIALNAPEYEVTDARQILDWLARQPEVVTEDSGDPLVGVAGVSYGGALSLLLAGTDSRVDAIAPITTYNDLTQALLPNSASPEPIPSDTPARGSFADDGVFKRAWAALLFAAGTRGSAAANTPRDAEPSASPSPSREELAPRESAPATPPSIPRSTAPAADLGTSNPQTSMSSRPDLESAICGNFIAEVCAAYTELARTGKASRQTLDLLAAASPASVTDNINVPTLLVQDRQDPLFGLAQADANARQISAAGGTVKMVWYAGEHGDVASDPALWSRVGDWFAHHLQRPGVPRAPDPGTAFEYHVVEGRQAAGEATSRTVVAPAYPGLSTQSTRRRSLPLYGAPARVINPPGGSTASIGSLSATDTAPDAAGAVDDRATGGASEQVATFRTSPVDQRVLITGVPQTRLSVSSIPGQASTGEAVLFAKLYDVGPGGQRELIGNGTAPLRITELPSDGTPIEVDVALPGVVHTLQTGHHLQLAVTTTDRAYATPDAPAVHLVGLTGKRALSLPSVEGTTTSSSSSPLPALAGMGAILLVIALGWGVTSLFRRFGTDIDTDLADTPLVVSGLSKSRGSQAAVVRELSMRVERGQIVGLLGVNGAGKTTVLRTVLGLFRPDRGEIRVFGHRVSPGSPVLSRVGALVESPGLLPHLSGMDNLKSHWAATGRPEEHACFEEALRITGLESAAGRPAGTYDHGMRQRLAIAQAMLGMPELLVLDEPTNGLDSPQSERIREVLRHYVSAGRSVLLSSRLLTEIEQTCTHVVAIHRDGQATAGCVEDVLATDGRITFRVDEPADAAETLRSLEGIGSVETDGDTVHVELAGHTAATTVNALVEAGVSVSRVGPRRGEDTFLQLLGEERR
ncbi:alpha/beta fold hydrolase [Halopolyspora algeriensis]|uniref:alpha/beta fold hydrolase n=1 Tax=Halopolyspora algeriensis TaxID=1500506 RepID=UPI0030B81416